MLNFLHHPWITPVLWSLMLALLALLALLVWAARRSADDHAESETPAAGGEIQRDALRRSFRSATTLIEQQLVSHANRYKLSWTVVLCDGDADASLALEASGLPGALSTALAQTAAVPGMRWSFFDKGVAVQLQSSALGKVDLEGHGDRHAWGQFLGLCQQYRAQRPLDAMVLAVPVADFLHPDAQSRVIHRAQGIHKRLWLAQNRLAMQFPVYLVLTGCEALAGFSGFAASLPDSMRRSLLGWSSPFELGQPFQMRWVDSSLDEVIVRVEDVCAELGALALPGQDISACFQLPADIERLRTGLRLFLDELMRPSVYHDPFLLRGYYFCGDGAMFEPDPWSPPAASEAESAAAAPSDARPGDVRSFDIGLPTRDAADAVPVFLRDIFEHKVFAEHGLVQLSRTRSRGMTPLGQLGWVMGCGAAAVWGAGLVWSGFRLAHTGSDILRVIVQIDQGQAEADHPLQLPLEVQRAQVRARALHTIHLLNEIQSGLMWSVFMPGSWKAMDNLQDSLRIRLERGFASQTMEPLRLMAHEEISRLTGVPLDPGTGALMTGASCRLPAGWGQTVGARQASGLNAEDQPEFEAILQFVARLEQLNAGVLALDRLLSGDSPTPAQDLRLAVKVLFAAELTGRLDATAHHIRQQSGRWPRLTMEPMQQAVACSWRLGMQSLHQRLFELNPLVQTELRLTDLALDIGNQREWPALLSAWQSVQSQLQEQSVLLQPGKGEWMHARVLQPGLAYDTVMQRVQTLQLLGSGSVAEVRKEAQTTFDAFMVDWQEVQAQAGGPLESALVWDDKSRRWSFDDDRQALREALNRLLAHPLLRGHVVIHSLPRVPPSASIGWDARELDHALAVADLRKKLQTDVLGAVPQGQLEPLQLLVNGVLANQVVAHLSDAVVYSTKGMRAPVVSEAERAKLVRVLGLLTELQAHTESSQLLALLSRDVVARLEVLDEAFVQSEVFWPGEVQIRKWQGDTLSLLGVWDAADAAGMSTYVAQQMAFVESSARAAEALLGVLDGVRTTDPLVDRWRQLVRVVAAYRLKSPGNSLTALEQFLQTGLTDLNTGNCESRLGQRSLRRSGDMFTQRLDMLQSSLLQRCRTLRTSEQKVAWGRMADIFNASLAGRFPFQSSGRGVPERSPALPEDVARWLRAYEPVKSATTAGWAGGSDLRHVDEALLRARTFLAPLFPADDAAAAGVDVAVEFRVQHAAEIEGNKMIDWSIRMGAETLGWRDPPRVLRWMPGVPVTLSLRVARDAAVVPRADPSQPQLSVDDRTVNFRWRDPWALMSMVAAHREAPAGNRDDPKAQLLRMEFPLVAVDQAAAAVQDRARVFVRLSVSAAGQRNPLPWPGPFPTRVPEWN